MDPEEVLNFFESLWFNLEIFKKQSNPSNFLTKPDQRNQENPKKEIPKFSSLPSILIRSKSDQLSSESSFYSDFLSPSSVLWTPKLQTILSGKEAITKEESLTEQSIEELTEPKKNRGERGRRRTKRGLSKSLSELEFEELKGFIDLGFVFSEEDKASDLVEIVPGLQRLGKEKDGGGGVESSSVHHRPYLSEAWEVLERREKVKPLMNWRIPSLSSEIDIKDSLKLWAHTVASTVR